MIGDTNAGYACPYALDMNTDSILSTVNMPGIPQRRTVAAEAIFGWGCKHFPRASRQHGPPRSEGPYPIFL